MIGIIDYGMGNLRSVQKAFERFGHAAEFVTTPQQLQQAEKLVLPGVGAFRDAIHEIKRLDLDQVICDEVASGKPLLGICLGLQLLFDVSFEDGEWEGLGILAGTVEKFPPSELKVPHIGWNTLQLTSAGANHPIMRGIPNECHFYFVHSYFVVPQDESVVTSFTEYGIKFVSTIARGQLFAAQFHPEKSQQAGLKLLANFASLPTTVPA